jgi:hypothetical protein
MATQNLGIPAFVDGQNNPDVTINTASDILDGLADALVHDMASDADYTLGTTGAYPREWQHLVIQVTDTGVVLTGDVNIIVPNNTRVYLFKNDTARTLTLKTSAGTGIAVATVMWALLRSDGTNVVRITPDA